MLDIKAIRANPEEVIKKLNRRGGEFRISEILELDEKRRSRLLLLPEKTQTFISAADFDPSLLSRGRRWLVEATPESGAKIR